VEILAGVLGALGSICLAVAPVKTLGIRRALMILAIVGLRGELSSARTGAEQALNQRALRDLELERRFNLLGATLLFVSFFLLILQAALQ
jgi:hypothetical protein